jgi:hypothetical protein
MGVHFNHCRPGSAHARHIAQLHFPFSFSPHSSAWTANLSLIALGRRHQRKTNHERLPIPFSFDISPRFPEAPFRLTPSLLPYLSIYLSPFLPLGQYCIVRAAVMRQLYAPFLYLIIALTPSFFHAHDSFPPTSPSRSHFHSL